MSRVKIRHLEDTLPKVPADTPRTRTGRTGVPPGTTKKLVAQTPAEEIVEKAGLRLERTGQRISKGSKSVDAFAASSVYRLIGSRVDMAKYSRNPEHEIRNLQQTLSLLVWELGTVLEDIDLAENTEKKDTK